MSSLIITKQTGNFFSLVLDGGSPIISEQNRLTTIGNFCNFKTANGANLILKQNILYSEITLIATGTFTFLSVTALWTKLIEVGFFQGLVVAGGGTATNFTSLLDTFPSYIGRDGQVLVVNESMQKIQTVAISVFSAADRAKLDGIEESAQVNVQSDWNQANPASDSFIKNKPPNSGALNIPVILDGVIGITAGFIVGQQNYTIPANGIVTDVYINEAKQELTTANNTSRVNKWSQAGTTLTITKSPVLNNYIYIEYIQT